MKRLNFFISEELNSALQRLEERDGVAKAESIRRALSAYLRQQGVLTEGTEKRKPKRGV